MLLYCCVGLFLVVTERVHIFRYSLRGEERETMVGYFIHYRYAYCSTAVCCAGRSLSVLAMFCFIMLFRLVLHVDNANDSYP